MATAAAGRDERLQQDLAPAQRLLARPELGAVAGTILVFVFFGSSPAGSGMFSAAGHRQLPRGRRPSSASSPSRPRC